MWHSCQCVGPIPPAIDGMVRWWINGRFRTQRMTGVQRYAHEVVREIGRLRATGDPLATHLVAGLYLPRLAQVSEVCCGLPECSAGYGGGHFWEQGSLPWVKGGILNLANTGPLLARRQIVCIHDANVYLAPKAYSKTFRTVYSWMLPALSRRALAITTVSVFSATQLSRFGIAVGREVKVLSNGHEHVFRWNADKSSLRAEFGEAERPFVLLLGSVAAHKNMALILGMANQLAELGVDIVVAGGQAAIFGSADHEAERKENVRMLGFVSDDDLAFLYGKALALVFPSLTEGFGLPVLEAMALGCPVITSNAASMPEIGGDAVLYASPTDRQAWLARVSDLLQSVSLRQELILAGRDRAQRFTWASTARGYLDLMRELSS